MTRTAAPFGALLWLVSGYVLWSLALVALYGLHGGACATGWAARSPETVRHVLWAIGAAHLVAGAVLLAWAWQRQRRPREASGPGARFVDRAAVALAAMALVSTAWLAFPTLFLGLC